MLPTASAVTVELLQVREKSQRVCLYAYLDINII